MAAAGWHKPSAGAYDLILLDVMLPGLDGFELLRQVRRRSCGADHHADRSNREGRSHRGTGRRRRRLSAQAVRSRRADRPHASRAAARRPAGSSRRRRPSWSTG